jgi:hypothetical protein
MNGRSVVQRRAATGLVALALVGCGGGGGGGGQASSIAGLPTAAAALPRGSGLVEFRRPGYSVGVLPGRSERFASSFQKLGLVVYLARHGNAATEVGAVATTFDEAAITGTIKGAARSAGGSVVDEVKTTYQGFPARDARIAGIAGNKATFFLRVIGAKHAGYVLGYIIKGSHTTPPAQYRAFLASLTID